MRQKLILPVLVVILLGLGGWYYFTQVVAASSSQFVLSGTIEATESNVPTRAGGIIKQIYVNEGDQITEGQPLIGVYNMNS